MKKTSMLSAAIIFASLAAFAGAPKYVFLFIGDGMSTPQRMVAEEFSIKTGGGQLVMNHFPNHATTRTRSASSLVTDSAAAATAIACGVKTYNGAIGVDERGNRVESVAELAKKCGRKVGIATSVTINHATPAGFYAHRKNRGLAYQIGLDLVNSGFDYFAGGGVSKHNDKKDPNYKGDIYDLAAEAGYKVIRDNKADFLALKNDGKKVFYAADSDDALPFDIDVASTKKDFPSLAEITAKGIELLDNPKGFFFMIEGGRIDWAGHGNDAASNLRDVIAMDKAVRVALDFLKKHEDDTLIIVTGDHETGGLTMGFAGTGYSLYTENLAHQKASAGALGSKINEAKKVAAKAKKEFTFEDVKPVLTDFYGFDFTAKDVKKNPMAVTDDELKRLEDAFEVEKLISSVKYGSDEYKELKKTHDKARLRTIARVIFNNKAGVGWTSGAHTALPVLTTAIGDEADEFEGFMENTDISKTLKKMYLDND